MSENKQNPADEIFQSIQSSPMSDADLLVAPLLLQGIKKVEIGEEKQALEVFRTATIQSPQSFKACYLLGRTALSLEMFADAMNALGNALALDPENIEVKYLIAHTHILLDMVEEAAGELQEIVSSTPDFVDAYYDCGVALQLLGRYDDAIVIFLKRLEISPDFDTAVMCAMTFEMVKNYEQTEKYYALALSLDPENIMVIESHGQTLMELERYEESLEDFNRALVLDSTSPDALCGRGQTRFHLGDVENALQDFQLTVKLDSENVIAWSMLGQIWLYQDAYEEALKCFNQALELDPELLIYDFRASARRCLGDLHGALADITLALEFEPTSVEYMIDKGSILMDMDRLEEALRTFNTVVKMDKGADAYRFRGLTYMEMLEYEKAIDDFTVAEKLGTENPDVFLRRGEAFYQLGEAETAFSDFSHARELAEAEGDVEFAQKCERLIVQMRAFEQEI
ncbi:MAG: tetratricopeptide repeat protein [Planctomycetia bacterium]|nr:tetratricopeptide repeat protein [Planctomycetia bacterium]